MPLADFKTLCVGVTQGGGTKCISFPGGAEICASVPSVLPVGSGEQALDLLGKLNTALAPLQPIFNIIDAALALFECAKATATLDPAEIIACTARS